MPARAISRPSLMLRGAAAGVVATVPMTLVMEAGHRLLPPAERYPLPPYEVTDAVLRQSGLPRQSGTRNWTPLTLCAHLAYGGAAGALYASRPAAWLPDTRLAACSQGTAFGLGVWLTSYLGLLPALGLLAPATEHPRRRSALMIVAHLVWGASLGFSISRAMPEKAS
jgi:hypothetical protein